MTKEEVFALPLNEDQRKVVRRIYNGSRRTKKQTVFEGLTDSNEVIELINSDVALNEKKLQQEALLEAAKEAEKAGISYDKMRDVIKKLAAKKLSSMYDKQIKEYTEKINEAKKKLEELNKS